MNRAALIFSIDKLQNIKRYVYSYVYSRIQMKCERTYMKIRTVSHISSFFPPSSSKHHHQNIIFIIIVKFMNSLFSSKNTFLKWTILQNFSQCIVIILSRRIEWSFDNIDAMHQRRDCAFVMSLNRIK